MTHFFSSLSIIQNIYIYIYIYIYLWDNIQGGEVWSLKKKQKNIYNVIAKSGNTYLFGPALPGFCWRCSYRTLVFDRVLMTLLSVISLKTSEDIIIKPLFACKTSKKQKYASSSGYVKSNNVPQIFFFFPVWNSSPFREWKEEVTIEAAWPNG